MTIENIPVRFHLLAAAVCCTGWIMIYTWLLTSFGFPLHIALTDSLLSNLFLGITGLTLNNIFRYYHPGRRGSHFILPWLLIIAAACGYANIYMLELLFSDDQSFLMFLENSLVIRIAMFFLALSIFVLLGWIINYIDNRMVYEKRKDELDNLARLAELSSLRQQLQPHFLFNSLNSINALNLKDPVKASAMITQLSDYFRNSLTRNEQDLIQLEDELRHLELYLNIEKVRFGHRLTTSIKREESAKPKVPSLILQPIVENAIKHGLYDTTGAVDISICTSDHGKMLMITVQNPFDPGHKPAAQGTGFGLSGVRKRLFLIYGRNDLLKTDPGEKLFTTTLLIPQ